MPVLHGLLRPGAARRSDAPAAVRHGHFAAAGSLRAQPGGHGCPAASRPAETGAHPGHHVHLWEVRRLKLNMEGLFRLVVTEDGQIQQVQLGI